MTAAATVLLLVALTACGSDDGAPEEKPATGKTGTPSKQVDCADEYLSQKERMDHCAEEDAGTGGDGTDGLVKTLKLGEPAQTIGDEGGVLQITPDTIVYAKEASGEGAENGVFAVITMKDKAMTGVPADEVAPISGGGWSWIAPDGESIGFDTGNSTGVSMDKYNSAGPVQPGTYQWRAQVFDLSEAQAKGGTLLYTDGNGSAYRWKMPSSDSGPHVAEVKQQLAS